MFNFPFSDSEECSDLCWFSMSYNGSIIAACIPVGFILGCVCCTSMSVKRVLPWWRWPTKATLRTSSGTSIRSARYSIEYTVSGRFYRRTMLLTQGMRGELEEECIEKGDWYNLKKCSHLFHVHELLLFDRFNNGFSEGLRVLFLY